MGSSNFIKSSKRSRSSGLESMLDELRKELAAIHGSMFPHSVLSTQQMCTISMQKPDSVEEVHYQKISNLLMRLHAKKNDNNAWISKMTVWFLAWQWTFIVYTPILPEVYQSMSSNVNDLPNTMMYIHSTSAVGEDNWKIEGWEIWKQNSSRNKKLRVQAWSCGKCRWWTGCFKKIEKWKKSFSSHWEQWRRAVNHELYWVRANRLLKAKLHFILF